MFKVLSLAKLSLAISTQGVTEDLHRDQHQRSSPGACAASGNAIKQCDAVLVQVSSVSHVDMDSCADIVATCQASDDLLSGLRAAQYA